MSIVSYACSCDSGRIIFPMLTPRFLGNGVGIPPSKVGSGFWGLVGEVRTSILTLLTNLSDIFGCVSLLLGFGTGFF